MAFEEEIIGFLIWLFPPWVIILIISMIPFIELRGALPLAYFGIAGLMPSFPLWQAFMISVIGNMIPVPLILYLFPSLEKWLRRWKWWDKAFTRLFKSTRSRYRKWFERHGDIAIVIFVGIPLPFTGAWTGSLISYLFGMKRSRSVFIIFVGVWMAAVIVSLLCLFFATLIGY